MYKIQKHKRLYSKCGFTLLEVMLAVCILIIASTMIMKGFIAVMIFANNNKAFAKKGEDNYRQAMSDFLVVCATGDQANTISMLNSSDASRNVHSQLNVTVQNCSVTIPNLYVAPRAFTEQGGLTNVDGNLYPIAVSGTDLSSATTASNRFAFFYDFGDSYHCSNDVNHKVRYGYVYNRTREGNDNGYNYGFYCFEDGCSNFINGTKINRS